MQPLPTQLRSWGCVFSHNGCASLQLSHTLIGVHDWGFPLNKVQIFPHRSSWLPQDLESELEVLSWSICESRPELQQEETALLLIIHDGKIVYVCFVTFLLTTVLNLAPQFIFLAYVQLLWLNGILMFVKMYWDLSLHSPMQTKDRKCIL